MTYERRHGHEKNGKWIRPPIRDDDEYTYQWNTEWAGDPDKPILKISKSSLGNFKWCKQQYEYTNLDARPIEQTDAMLKGTIIHDSYEQFYNDVDMDIIKGGDFINVRNYFTSLFPIDDYVDMTHSMATFEAQRYITAKENGTTQDFLPAGNEFRIGAKIVIEQDCHKKFPLSRNYIVYINGIVDRMFKEGNAYIPMEFKTGAWKDSKITSMRREMAFYKLLIESTSREDLAKFGIDKDIPITHWGWYYPASNHLTIEPVKTRTMNATKQAIAELLFSYENNFFPPSYFHKKCVHCSFFSLCPAAKESAIAWKDKEDWFNDN